jgi:hypothetical protein
MYYIGCEDHGENDVMAGKQPVNLIGPLLFWWVVGSVVVDWRYKARGGVRPTQTEKMWFRIVVCGWIGFMILGWFLAGNPPGFEGDMAVLFYCRSAFGSCGDGVSAAVIRGRSPLTKSPRITPGLELNAVPEVWSVSCSETPSRLLFRSAAILAQCVHFLFHGSPVLGIPLGSAKFVAKLVEDLSESI